MNTHKFKVGQLVTFDRGFSSAVEGHYEIVKLMPVESGAIIYRIKSNKESHERVAREDQLASARS